MMVPCHTWLELSLAYCCITFILQPLRRDKACLKGNNSCAYSLRRKGKKIRIRERDKCKSSIGRSNWNQRHARVGHLSLLIPWVQESATLAAGLLMTGHGAVNLSPLILHDIFSRLIWADIKLYLSDHSAETLSLNSIFRYRRPLRCLRCVLRETTNIWEWRTQLAGLPVDKAWSQHRGCRSATTPQKTMTYFEVSIDCLIYPHPKLVILQQLFLPQKTRILSWRTAYKEIFLKIYKILTR